MTNVYKITTGGGEGTLEALVCGQRVVNERKKGWVTLQICSAIL